MPTTGSTVAWVAAPSGTRASDGLGPLFTARSCAVCHPGGGASSFASSVGGLKSVGLVAKFHGEAGSGDPYYDQQLQTGSLPGHAPEGSVSLGIDGEPIHSLTGQTLRVDTKVGPRRAPTLAGRGLIARVTDQAVLALADPSDKDGDGISGRARLIDDHIGKFGWRADHATLENQVAAAFFLDLGLSSARFPAFHGDCTVAQQQCRAGFDGSDDIGGGFELSDKTIEMVSTYVARFGRERPGSVEGLSLFESVGCAACHTPTLATGNGHAWVFSDLLLHNLGAGLVDETSPYGVTPDERRTAPLIGLSTSGSRLLHDGRAETVHEAISWHGGEADVSRKNYEPLEKSARAKLLEYVEGL